MTGNNYFSPSARPSQLLTMDWSPGIPPPIQDVQTYFVQKGASLREAEVFFLFFERAGWISRRGNPILRWKPFAWRWIQTITDHSPWRIDRSIH